ncbi:MAG: sugar phosphorylase [Carboxylicivirga sp.]|jgi:sucrose phosphorylase|nr:sugar phosphorylase [Carboxylicivirga sp.]
MKTIQQNIKHLYPQHANEVMNKLDTIIHHYKSNITSEAFNLTANDVVLISYADSFKKSGEKSLKTLNKAYNELLSECVNYVHILPFYPFTSDDGFSVVDYLIVNPEYGDWEDIQKLSGDVKLMFDAVINHISKSSDWFKNYLKGHEDFANFFIEEDPSNEDLKKVTRPRTHPLLHPYIKDEKEVYVWTTFSEDQVDINYGHPDVFLKVLEVLLEYISYGARMIRLDAIAFMWKKLGTSCIHLDETHMIIQTYRSILELVAPQVVIITETNVPHNENISYFGDGTNEAHMVYNFSLPPLLAFSIHNENVEVLTNWAQSLQLPSEQTCFFNFTASHDGIGVRPLQGIISDEEINHLADKAKEHGGFVSYKTNPDGSESPYELNCNYMDFITNPSSSHEERAQRFLLSQSVMITMPGVPGVYYHSLLGSSNDVDGAKSSGIKRRINREKLDFATLSEELNNNQSLRYKVHQRYKNMLKIRKGQGAFHPFGQAKFYNDNGLFIIERNCDNESILCLHNFTSEEKSFSQYAHGTILLDDGATEKEVLKPFSFIWIKKL